MGKLSPESFLDSLRAIRIQGTKRENLDYLRCSRMDELEARRAESYKSADDSPQLTIPDKREVGQSTSAPPKGL
jgi:hypothetical protein